MIRLDGVGQVFDGRGGEIQALEGIDLHVQENEFVTLIGRSGCGKSTLLRLIAGLLPPTYGGVEVAGEAVKGPRRDVSFMFQRPALLPWRSVLSNVLLPVEISGGKDKGKKAYRDRAHELLELVGLTGFERRLPHELSGGMQQRVSLCRSLIRDPKVMLMDEPFSALDALTRTELSEELQRIQMELATTIVFVTHSIEEAVLLADRVVVLSPRPGRLREIVEIDIPRPRSLGQDAQVADVARISSRLHSLLSEKALQDSARTPQLSGTGNGAGRPMSPRGGDDEAILADHLAVGGDPSPRGRTDRRDRSVVAGRDRVLDRAVPAADPGAGGQQVPRPARLPAPADRGVVPGDGRWLPAGDRGRAADRLPDRPLGDWWSGCSTRCCWR